MFIYSYSRCHKHTYLFLFLVNSTNQVKFNRKGIAAFRVLSMDASTAENTVLNWRPAEKVGFSAKLLRLGKSEGIDLKTLKVASAL